MSFWDKRKTFTSIERLNNLFGWTEINNGLYPFYWIDPTEEDALKQVKAANARNIMGFKIICNHFYPSDDRAIPVYHAIAELGKPILFHSGILWDNDFSSIYNRATNFEALLSIENLRFALAHISWPWCDECIAVYGKYANMKRRKEGYSTEMFIDITPGTPLIYRKEALTKLLTVGYPVENNILFGVDNSINDYSPRYSTKIIDFDNTVYNDLGIDQGGKAKILGENLLHFLNIRNGSC